MPGFWWKLGSLLIKKRMAKTIEEAGEAKVSSSFNFLFCLFFVCISGLVLLYLAVSPFWTVPLTKPLLPLTNYNLRFSFPQKVMVVQ